MSWLRVGKAARALNVSPAAVMRLAKAGTLPSRKTRLGIEVQVNEWRGRRGIRSAG